MKRRITVFMACLCALAALSGCSNSAGKPNADVTPSASPSAGTDGGSVNGGIPNNANGTANNDGTVTGGETGTGTPKTTAHGGDGVLQDAGNAVRDAVDGAERAVRDIL